MIPDICPYFLRSVRSIVFSPERGCWHFAGGAQACCEFVPLSSKSGRMASTGGFCIFVLIASFKGDVIGVCVPATAHPRQLLVEVSNSFLLFLVENQFQQSPEIGCRKPDGPRTFPPPLYEPTAAYLFFPLSVVGGSLVSGWRIRRPFRLLPEAVLFSPGIAFNHVHSSRKHGRITRRPSLLNPRSALSCSSHLASELERSTWTHKVTITSPGSPTSLPAKSNSMPWTGRPPPESDPE